MAGGFISIGQAAQVLQATMPTRRYVQRDLPISKTTIEEYSACKDMLVDHPQAQTEWPVYKELMLRLTELVKNRTGVFNTGDFDEIRALDDHIGITIGQMVILNSELAFRHSSVRHWTRQLAYIDYRIETAREARHAD